MIQRKNALVAFCHGYRSHVREWAGCDFKDHVIARGFDCEAWNLPYHGKYRRGDNGRGTVNASYYRVTTAHQLSRVLNDERGAPVFLVGESLGAVAICEAIRFFRGQRGLPLRLAGIVCIAMPFFVDHNAAPWAQMAQKVIMRSPFLKNLLADIPVSANNLCALTAEGVRDTEYLTRGMSLQSALHVRRMVEDVREQMSVFDEVPKLFVHGSDDHIARPEDIPPLPNSGQYIFGGGGHHLLYEHGAEVAEVAAGWMRHILRKEYL